MAKNQFVDYSQEKEMIHSYNVIAINNGKMYDPVTLRIYKSRSPHASTIYASFWAGKYRGSGSAGGYGYDKSRTAAWEAVDKAGLDASGFLPGSPKRAIRDALSDIARSLGYEGELLIVEN
ncbi:MAG: hypothetical protein Q8O94_02845 [bacterium]|nr:hypothetical protein [bacterium]